MNFLRKILTFYKREFVLFLLSLIVSCIFFIFLVLGSESGGYSIINSTGDSKAYTILAENLLNENVFSLSAGSPYLPDSFRSPGFPFFLAILFLIFHSWISVIVLHMLMASLVPVLLYSIFKRFNERIAFWASMIFVFDFTRIFLSSALLTDTLFTLLFLFCLYLMSRRKDFSIKLMLFIGFILGLATLVRPILIFSPILFSAFIFISLRHLGTRIVFRYLTAFILFFVLTISPWAIRNKIVFGTFSLSSVSSYNLIYYNIPEFLKYRDGVIKDQRVLSIYESNKNLSPLEVISFSRTNLYDSVSGQILKENFFEYTKFHLIKTVPFFVTDGFREVFRTLGLGSSQPINISTSILKGDVRALSNYFFNLDYNILFFFVGFLFWLFVFILFLLGIFFIFKEGVEYKYSLLLLALSVFYFAFLTGPVSNARYRFPVSGIMIFFAVYNLFIIVSFLRKKYESKQ